MREQSNWLKKEPANFWLGQLKLPSMRTESKNEQ